MDFTVKKDSINGCEANTVSSAEHTVDCDITLPEYMPDVVRVLRCCLAPSVASQQISGDRIMTECDCTASVIYICEQGKVHCFEQTEHFGKQLEFNGEYQDSVSVGIKTEFVNYRVSSSRKVEIHGAVSLAAVGLSKQQKEVVSCAEGDGMTVRAKNMNVCTLSSFAGKAFSVSETCEINCSEKIAAVLSVNHFIRTDEAKAIHGKLFIRGEMSVRTVCLTEESEIRCFENSVPVNQIVDVPDIAEENIIQTDINVTSVSVRPRAEQTGDRGLLEIEATLYISVRAYETREIAIVRDAYSTKYETETEMRTVGINTSCEKLYDTFLCRESIDISSVGIQKVLSFECSNIVSNVSVNDGAVTVSGSITADCIFEDTNSEIYYVTRQIPFEYKHSAVYENMSSSSISAAVSAFNYALGTGGSLDVRIEIAVNGLAFCGTEEKAVTEITIDKSKCKSVKTASLTVYFADENECVWDIARHYNTTVEAILRENRMQNEEITHCCKLLIPKI